MSYLFLHNHQLIYAVFSISQEVYYGCSNINAIQFINSSRDNKPKCNNCIVILYFHDADAINIVVYI